MIDNITGEGPIEIAIAAGTATNDVTGDVAPAVERSGTSWVYQTNLTWVDFDADDGGDGSESSPFNTMQAALDAMTPCGEFRILTGETNETLVISNAVRLQPVGGTVRIGVPSARSSSPANSASAVT